MAMPKAVTTMLERYNQLEKRDRTALIGLATFFGLLILWFGVWQPVNTYYEDNKAERERQLSLIQYMRASESIARKSAAGSRQARASGQTLLSVISTTAQRLSIKPNRLQPEGNDTVSVWFDQVAFNTLVKLLSELDSRHGVTVKQITIDREDTAGMVRTRIVLGS